MNMNNAIYSNYWLVDAEEDIIGLVSTKPVTLAFVADYLIENTTLHINDIWETNQEELEFAQVEILRI